MHQSPLHRPRRLARRDTRRRAATAVTASFAAVLLAGGITAATLSITSAAQATAGKAALSVNWYESAPARARSGTVPGNQQGPARVGTSPPQV